MKQIVLIFLWLVSCPLAVRADSDLTVEQALNLFEGSVQSITSFDVTLNCSLKATLKVDAVKDLSKGNKKYIIKDIRKFRADEKPEVRKKSYRQVFQAGKGRVEVLEVDGKKTGEVTVYNPESQKSFQPQRMEAAIRDKALQSIEEGWDYRETFETMFGNFSIMDCLRERKKNVTIGSGDLRESLVVLEFPGDPNGKNTVSFQSWGFRVFLDRDHGFLPVTIERFQEINGKLFTLRRMTVNEWKKLPGGSWVPIKATTQFFQQNPDFDSFGAVLTEAQLAVDLPRSSWNKAIREDSFTLPLPVGTKVIDTLRQVQFITGKPDPGTNLEDLAANARKMTPYPVAKAPPILESRSPWTWVAWGTGAVVSLFVLWLTIRFLRQRRTRYAK